MVIVASIRQEGITQLN